jgi:Raf kinase inhibitor-like YbhB/YbcL family protein
MKILTRITALTGTMLLIIATAAGAAPATGQKGIAVMELRSPEFAPNAAIPARFTADGANVSPSLEWRGAPAGVKSYALIMDDPDAPAGIWVHWVLYDIPPAVTRLPQEIPRMPLLPDGTKQGQSDGGGALSAMGYVGPNPPPGATHRYFFKIYALNAKLNLPPRATKFQVEAAMQGRIVGRGELIGTYAR